jgi:hypothetical protein
MKTGLIFNEPADKYHATEAVSSSRLADMRIAGALCPANYYALHVAKLAPKKDGAYFDIGTAAHLAILEGAHTYAARVVVQPEEYMSEKGEIKPWHGGANACKLWNSQHADFLILKKSEAEMIQRMEQAVLANPIAAQLASAGVAEVTFRVQIGGITLQCRADKWHPNGCAGIEGPVMTDLKTCDTIERFEREFYFLRYNFRAEFYRLVGSQVLAEMAGVDVAEISPPTFRFVVVEKQFPHRVKVYEPDFDSLEAGRREVHADLKTLRECMASGVWPDNCAGVHSIGLRSWQLAKSEETSSEAINA